MSILTISGLKKYFGNISVINDLNFSVEKGELFGFLGPNGSGKTTTIRMILNLTHPDSGAITLFGESSQKLNPQVLNRIGYLPGDFSAYPEMTGWKFLNYMERFRQNPPKLRQSLIEKLQLSSKDLATKTRHLSHGTRQKIGIVLALEHDPDLAILDEPTLGLDPLIQDAFYEILFDFQQREKTVFLSSHILPEVEKICQRIAIIRNGKIIALESIQSMRDRCPRKLIITTRKTDMLLPEFENARLIDKDNTKLTYLVDGEISELVKEIAILPSITNIIFPEPDLGDIFLDLYNGKGNNEH